MLLQLLLARKYPRLAKFLLCVSLSTLVIAVCTVVSVLTSVKVNIGQVQTDLSSVEVPIEIVNGAFVSVFVHNVFLETVFDENKEQEGERLKTPIVTNSSCLKDKETIENYENVENKKLEEIKVPNKSKLRLNLEFECEEKSDKFDVMIVVKKWGVRVPFQQRILANI